MNIKSLINRILPSRGWKVFALVVADVLVGTGALFAYMLRARATSVHTYSS